MTNIQSRNVLKGLFFFCLFTACIQASAQGRIRKFTEVIFEKEAILSLLSPTPTYPNHSLAGLMFLIDTMPIMVKE